MRGLASAPASGRRTSLLFSGARFSAWIAAAAALFASASGPAHAQATGSLSVESDYRLRGVSITGGRPAGILDLAYDVPGGPYLGASAIVAAPPDHSIGLLGHIAYVGYALRSAGRTLDLGVTDTQWTTYSAASPSIYGAGGGEISRKIHYTEAYAAIAGDNLRFAVQYSPNYIVTHSQALYFDLTGSARPAPEWRVFAHAGYLDPIMKPAGPAVFTSRYDWRVGVSRALGPADLHLALTSHTGPVPSGQTRTALVAGASVYF